MLELRRVSYDHPDAVALTALAQTFYEGLYGEPDATPLPEGTFAPPAGAFFVGYLDGEPVSMGGWRFSTAGEPAGAERPAEVKRMFVREDVRGQGLARHTLAALEEDARSAGADWMILETGAPQVAALAFYRARGYDRITNYGHYRCAPDVVSLGRRLSSRGSSSRTTAPTSPDPTT